MTPSKLYKVSQIWLSCEEGTETNLIGSCFINHPGTLFAYIEFPIQISKIICYQKQNCLWLNIKKIHVIHYAICLFRKPKNVLAEQQILL